MVLKTKTQLICDLGMDIYYFSEDGKDVEVPSLGKVKLTTGLKFAVPHGFAMEIKNRSGLASKKGLLVGPCLIDPGYKGEVLIGLHNTGSEAQIIKPGDKIAQFIIFPVVHVRIQERTETSLYDDSDKLFMSNRDDGGFGSTGV